MSVKKVKSVTMGEFVSVGKDRMLEAATDESAKIWAACKCLNWNQ